MFAFVAFGTRPCERGGSKMEGERERERRSASSPGRRKRLCTCREAETKVEMKMGRGVSDARNRIGRELELHAVLFLAAPCCPFVDTAAVRGMQ